MCNFVSKISVSLLVYEIHIGPAQIIRGSHCFKKIYSVVSNGQVCFSKIFTELIKSIGVMSDHLYLFICWTGLHLPAVLWDPLRKWNLYGVGNQNESVFFDKQLNSHFRAWCMGKVPISILFIASLRCEFSTGYFIRWEFVPCCCLFLKGLTRKSRMRRRRRRTSRTRATVSGRMLRWRWDKSHPPKDWRRWRAGSRLAWRT